MRLFSVKNSTVDLNFPKQRYLPAMNHKFDHSQTIDYLWVDHQNSFIFIGRPTLGNNTFRQAHLVNKFVININGTYNLKSKKSKLAQGECVKQTERLF